MKKRFLAMILAITMLTSVVEPVTDTVYAATIETPELVASYSSDEYGNLIKDSVGNTEDDNDLFGHMLGASGDNTPNEPTQSEMDSAQMFNDSVSAGNYLKEQMKQRNGRIVFTMDRVVYDNNKEDDVISVYHQAIMHTGNPQEGDYLYNQLHETKSAVWKYSDKAVYVYDITYRTSLTEEQELTAAIKQMEKVIPWGNDTTDVEKSAVREIYRYICDNYSYDTESYNEYMSIKDDPDYKSKMSKVAIQSHTAYGTYKQKKAVCQGLADLFYRICLDRGIDCRIMYSKTHAWNAVKIDDKWYMCDATGDVQKNSYNYDKYLLARTDLIDYDLKHKVDTYKWQDVSVMWDWEVVNGYDWAVFEYNSIISAVCRGFKKAVTLSKSNKTGKQSAKFYDKDGNRLKEGIDYTITYAQNYDANKDKYNTKMIVTGIGKYAGSELVKYYNKKIAAPKIKRVTYKVIKREKNRDIVEVRIYFDGVAGARKYYATTALRSKNKGYTYSFWQRIFHGMEKCKNGEYCYVYTMSSTFCGSFDAIITAEGNDWKWSEKGLYTFKLPSEKAMRKVKVGKTVALKTNNNYRKHKDCVACGTCKHSFPHKGENHNLSDCIYVKF